VSAQYASASQAKVGEKYATVIYADGNHVIVPVKSLRQSDLAWLTELELKKSFEGKSTRVVKKTTATVPIKKTITVSKIENGLETVQLCSPAVSRDQIGPTCMIYARVRWLDIAGYYCDAGDLYKIINDSSPDAPLGRS
jgi:hypothetical protein